MPRQPITPDLSKGSFHEYVRSSSGKSRRRRRGKIASSTISNGPGNDQCNPDPGPLVNLSKELFVPRILALPIEIRFMIYKEVLRVEEVGLSPEVEHLDLRELRLTRPRFVSLCRKVRRGQQKHSVLAILEVCSIFYHEAQTIFYQINHIRVCSPVMLFYFLTSLTKVRRSAIRSLRVGGVGIHYTGFSLTARAFSLLSLCRQLRKVEIELIWALQDLRDTYGVWDSLSITSDIWNIILGVGRFDKQHYDDNALARVNLFARNYLDDFVHLERSFLVLFNLSCIDTLDISLHITYCPAYPPFSFINCEPGSNDIEELKEGFCKVKEQWERRLLSARELNTTKPMKSS